MPGRRWTRQWGILSLSTIVQSEILQEILCLGLQETTDRLWNGHPIPPDLTPIEHCWTMLKEKLQQHFPNIHKTKRGPDTVRRYLAEVLFLWFVLRILKAIFLKVCGSLCLGEWLLF